MDDEMVCVSRGDLDAATAKVWGSLHDEQERLRAALAAPPTHYAVPREDVETIAEGWPHGSAVSIRILNSRLADAIDRLVALATPPVPTPAEVITAELGESWRITNATTILVALAAAGYVIGREGE